MPHPSHHTGQAKAGGDLSPHVPTKMTNPPVAHCGRS
jgi:hypothetical protein